MSDTTSQTPSQSSEVTAWTPLKQWLIHDMLPFAICVVVCVFFVSHDDEEWVKRIIFLPLFGSLFLALRAFIKGLYVIQICSFRRNMRKPDPNTATEDEIRAQKAAEEMIEKFRKEAPSLSERALDEAGEKIGLKKIDPSLPMEVQNELVFKEYLNYLDVIIENRAKSGVVRFPPKVEVWISRKFWRTYFSIPPELLNEWTRKYLELDIRGGKKNSDIESIERFEKFMDKFDLDKIGDFFTFKKFLISDMITLLWILASVGDVYVFFKFIKDTMKDGPFFVLLILSLLGVRIVCEYTVVLFSIADLTREVRDELRKSNAKNAEEEKGVES